MKNKNRYKYVFIVLVYRNTADLKEFIQNVKSFNLHSHIVIVNSFYDKKSKMKIEQIAEENGCTFLNVENKGYGYGNNRGIEYIHNNFEYEYIIISNPDIEIQKFNGNDLEKYNQSVIGGIIITSSNKKQNPYWYIENSIGEYLIYKGYKNMSKYRFYIGIVINKLIREIFLIYFKLSKLKFKRVFALHGSFVVFPKLVIDKIGLPYDEDMFLFAEEAYLAHLLKSYNINSYITKDIKVLHKEDGCMSLSNIDENSECRKSVIKYYEKIKNK